MHKEPCCQEYAWHFSDTAEDSFQPQRGGLLVATGFNPW